MGDFWTPEQIARMRQVAIERLRDVKRELSQEADRRPDDLNYRVSIDYNKRFLISVEDLRKAGVSMPSIFEGKVNLDQDSIRGAYVRDRVDDVLELLKSDQPFGVPKRISDAPFPLGILAIIPLQQKRAALATVASLSNWVA
jgi:hypothetical protein